MAWTLLSGSGLTFVYIALAELRRWDAHGSERPKVAMSRSRRLAWLRSMIHIVPVATPVFLTVLSYSILPFSLTEFNRTYGTCTTHNPEKSGQGWGYWCAHVP